VPQLLAADGQAADKILSEHLALNLPTAAWDSCLFKPPAPSCLHNRLAEPVIHTLHRACDYDLQILPIYFIPCALSPANPIAFKKLLSLERPVGNFFIAFFPGDACEKWLGLVGVF